jgi:hypothetical protein
VESSISACFPTVPAGLRRVCEYCLASLVYHASYLCQVLPSTHLIFESALFTSTDMLSQLNNIVCCRSYCPEDPIRPTGVPAHIGILVSLSELKNELKNIGPSIVSEVRGCIEQQSLNVLNETRIQTIMESVLDLRGIHAPTIEESPPPHSTMIQPPMYTPFTWGNGFRRVPRDFSFPRGTLATAWRYWCVGCPTAGHPPYKLLSGNDMATENNKKRLSEFQRLMRMVESCLQRLGINLAIMSEADAANIISTALPHLPLPRDRLSRCEQLSWVSLVRYAPRSRTRQRRTAVDG